MREICTSGSVGALGGKPSRATRFISGGMMLLAAVFLILSLGIFGAVLGLVYVVGGGLYAYASYLLLSYLQQIKAFQRTGSGQSLQAALMAQKGFWKLIGITTIVMFVVSVLGGIGIAATGAMFASRMAGEIENMDAEFQDVDGSGNPTGQGMLDDVDNGGGLDFGPDADLDGSGGLPGTSDDVPGTEIDAPGFDVEAGTFDLTPGTTPGAVSP